MNERILCVDDDPSILEGFKRGLRRQFEIDTAGSGEEGLRAVSTRGPYAVIVSDMRMPGLDGVQFLAVAKQRAPDSVRIMLTGHADQQTAIEAVNEGSIFRFLNKPCGPESLARALTAGVEQYRLITAEKELLSKTLQGSIKVLTDVLALVNPRAFGRASRVRRLMQQLAAQFKVDQPWRWEIAAMLSQIGLIALPPETVEKLHRGEPLLGEDARMFESHPRIGRDLVANIPRLEGVAEIIAYQERRFDGGGLPVDDRRGVDIPLGARALKVALDLDAHRSRGFTVADALRRLGERPTWYDPVLLAALETVVGAEANDDVRDVDVAELTEQMVIAEDVETMTGTLLVSKGQEVTRSLCERLGNFLRRSDLKRPIRVVLRRELNSGAEAVTAPAALNRRVPQPAGRVPDR